MQHRRVFLIVQSNSWMTTGLVLSLFSWSEEDPTPFGECLAFFGEQSNTKPTRVRVPLAYPRSMPLALELARYTINAHNLFLSYASWLLVFREPPHQSAAVRHANTTRT